MKLNLQTVFMYIAILLSVNTIAQKEIQELTFSSLEKKYDSYLDIDENVVVISILDPKYPNKLKKLDQLAEKYKNTKVTFIAITDEINDSISNSFKHQLVHYQHKTKKENEIIFNRFQTGMFKVFPMQIILNKEGKIIYKKKGPTNNIEDKLTKRIDKLLSPNSFKFKNLEPQYTLK